MTRRSPMLGLLMVTALSVAVAGQSTAPPTSARVRALAKEAESRAKGDPNELVLALDKRFREIWGDFESFPISIIRRDDILITLTTPYMGYRRALVEHLRMRRGIAEVPWVDAAIVSVGLNRVDAPDILEVVVERDGKRIPPIANGLKPMSFQNGNGQSAVLHAGDVSFPMSAFAPGATVIVAAVPAIGSRISMTFEPSQLQELK